MQSPLRGTLLAVALAFCLAAPVLAQGTMPAPDAAPGSQAAPPPSPAPAPVPPPAAPPPPPAPDQAAPAAPADPFGEELTLNASNVVVREDDFDDEGRGPAPGEYVALTVMGEGAPEEDATWSPRRPARSGILQRLADRLAAADVQYAYTRSFDGKGTITVFLAREA